MESGKAVSAGDQGAEGLYGLARKEAGMPGIKSGLGSRRDGRMGGMKPWSRRVERV